MSREPPRKDQEPGGPGSAPGTPARPLRRRRRARRFAIAFALCFAIGAAGAVVFPIALAGERETRLVVSRVASGAEPREVRGGVDARAAPPADGILRVMSLNIAHGRGTALHQFLCERPELERNLDACAEMIRRERAHLVLLQEADGPSSWSGSFDHVEHLARRSCLGWHARGKHVDGLTISYGTAMISALEFRDPVACTFPMSPPTLSKGYLVATLDWPGRPGVEVDIVSVHLDFSRGGVRKTQVTEMIAGLSGRGRPLIVIGDLNCEWRDEDSPVRRLAEGLGLRAYAPEAGDLVTFPSLERRLDWVLVSGEIAFVAHRVLDDTVSDHRAVVADLRLTAERG